MELDTAKHWQIDCDAAFGSDHFALHWETNHEAVEVENVTGEQYNFKDTDVTKWQESFQEGLWGHMAALSPLQNH